MSSTRISHKRKGYSRYEFQRIVGIAHHFSFIKDIQLEQYDNAVTIYFKRHSAHSPIFWVEKYENGPQKSLFVAYSEGARGSVVEIARSEKLDSFIGQLGEKMEIMQQTATAVGSNIRSIIPHASKQS